MTQFYPLGDMMPGYGVAQHRFIRAVRTGEFRVPRTGEWYLSGAIITAYRASHDMPWPFHIARIVRIEVSEHIAEYLTGAPS